MGDAQEEWVAKIAPTVASRSTLLLRNYPEHSIAPDGDSEPSLLVLRYTTLAPGNNDAYSRWLGEKLVPALKAGGATGVKFNRVVYGGDTNRWVSGARIPNYAALDTPGPLGSLTRTSRRAVSH